MFDVIFRQVNIRDGEPLVDIGIADGRIAEIGQDLQAEGAEVIEGEGRVVVPGLVEAHIHLDKALIADRKPNRSGTVKEAIAVTAELKPTFTSEDVRSR